MLIYLGVSVLKSHGASMQRCPERFKRLGHSLTFCDYGDVFRPECALIDSWCVLLGHQVVRTVGVEIGFCLPGRPARPALPSGFLRTPLRTTRSEDYSLDRSRSHVTIADRVLTPWYRPPFVSHIILEVRQP